MVMLSVLQPESGPIRGRVALIIPRWTDPSAVEPQGTPFRSFTMGGALLAAGYELVYFDQEHDLDRKDRFDELVVELDGAQAAFIWMNESYPSNQFANSVAIAKRLRESLPDLTVVAGGEMITICPPEFFELELPFDFLLRGNGEESGVRLLEELVVGRRPDGIPGLSWRSGAGDWQHRPVVPKAIFLREYLALYYRLDLSDYIQIGGVLGNDQPTLTIATGRGCTKGCSFCCWSKHRARVRGAQELFELMVYLRDKYGVRQFHNAELDFFLSRKRALELADLLAERAPDIGWFALASPADLMRLSDGDWDRLRAGGLMKLELGSESGSDRVLASIGKKHRGEDIYTISERMLRRGIVPMNNFLFGFPGEKHADRAETLQLIHRLLEISVERNAFTYRHYQPVWGTGLGDRALAAVPDRPRRVDRWLAERPYYGDEGVRTMPWMPAADESELKRLINYDLPMATSRFAVSSRWRRVVYRALRARARKSLERGGRDRGIDRWIFERVVARQLDRTYIP